MFALHTPSHPHRAILLGLFIAVSASGCQSVSGAATPAVRPSAGEATVAAAARAPDSAARTTLGDPAIQALLGDLRAARTRHDARAFQSFRQQLTDGLGAPTVDAAEATYRQVLGNLIAAETLHDARARARYRLELRALCDPTGLTSALVPCETDLAAHAG